ncbi:ABC transporter ATP-binding protein [Anaerosporobacter sp.]
MLELQDLCKKYGRHTVLDNMNLHIEKGQLFGLVGPNGAGKTTLIKIIAGLLELDYGSVLVDGKQTSTKERRSHTKIGYMPDYFGVYQNLKVYEYMDFYTQMYGYKGKEAKNKVEENLELVNLLSRKDEYVDDLSRGIKQRLCLARCLLSEPELLLLDEPTSGLDPRGRNDIRNILNILQGKGMTIIISSHILQDLSQMCSHIGIVDNGKMVTQGPVEDILQMEEQSKPLRIRFTEVNSSLLKYLGSHVLISNLTIDGTQTTMRFEGDSMEEAKLLTTLIQNGARICYFAREEGNLEKLFLRITKGE